MGNDDKTDSSKESVLRFGLKINKVIKGKNFPISTRMIILMIIGIIFSW